MMPLSYARVGEVNTIRQVSGAGQTRQFLESLGFVPGGAVAVVQENGGNLIVDVKGARIAVSREMAARIMI